VIDKDAILKTIAIVEPEDFFIAKNRAVYAAMVRLHNEGVAIDHVTLAARLREANQLDLAGGEGAITGLINAVPTSIHVEHYARIVERLATRRRLIKAGADIVQSAYGDDDVEQTLSAAEKKVFDVRASRYQTQTSTPYELASRVVDQLEHQLETGAIPGIELGISNVDKILGYVEPHQYIIIAGRPGFGKSSTLRAIAYELAFERSKPVALFSLEETGEAAMKSLAGIKTGLNTDHFKKFNEADDDTQTTLLTTLGEIADSSLLYITAAGMLDPYQIRAMAKQINARSLRDHGEPLAAVLIDHIQKVRPTADTRRMSRNHQVEEISGIFKAMTMPGELYVPVFAACQLNRAVETRSGGGRPTLADLRDSGALEQDADGVIFTWPKTAYMSPNDRKKALKGFEEGWEPLVFCIDKNRDGDTGEALCSWNKSTGRIRSVTMQEG
jgi:replicative DNA helicase